MTATVYQYREDSVTEIKQTPRRCSRSRSYPHCQTLEWSRCPMQYTVSKCTNAQPEEETTESIARTQPEEVLVQIPKTFTQEYIRPFQRPQLGSKQQRESAILTDSPVKVSKVAKIRNRYNQVPHLIQDTNETVTNSQKTPQTRAKRSALSQQVTTKHI